MDRLKERMNVERLRHRRILVVEDDALLAWAYEQMLQDVGADVVGPAATLADAEQHAVASDIEAALLDIRLGEVEVWPAARLLAARGIPFVFCTGHCGAGTLPAEWSDRPVLTKPVSPDRVLCTLGSLLASKTA